MECLRRAEAIGDLAFTHICGFLKEGMSETEVALELEFFMRRNGAECLSFDTIAVSGVRSSLPHGEPSDKKIEAGDFLTMDFGCKYLGYCSDMTRTVAIGKVTDEMKKVYGIVQRAQQTALEAINPGKKASDIDKTARDIIKYEGYGNCFGHGTGHGVGLEIHEAPTANPTGETVLKPGMSVTVEPGIYLPGRFGVRIEDLALVTETGYEVLSHSDKDLIII
jgi:Xaa-Pro aminopeptidase